MAFAAYGKYTKAAPENIAVEADYSHIASFNDHISAMRQLIDTTAGSPFIVENGVVRMTDAFMTNMVAMNAFIENLTAKSIDTRVSEQGTPCGRGIHITKMTQIETLQISAIAAYDKDGNLSSYWRTGEAAVYSDNALLIPPLFNLTYFNGQATLNYHNVEFKTPTGERAEYGIDGIKLPSIAKVDMPGVALCIGTANRYGTVTEQWGAVNCRGGRSTEGQRFYTITHDLGHKNYHLDVVPHRLSDGWCAFSYAMVTKGTHSATFAIVSGDTSDPADVVFEFQLTGRNKIPA